MKCICYYPIALLCVCLLSGCASFEVSSLSGDFVRTTLFSSLDTFQYKHTLVSGMAFRQDSQEMVLKQVSERVLSEELVARGFEAVSEDVDFYVVTKWRKEINLSAVEVVRFSLIIELFEAATQKVFWRAELPHILSAMQWSEDRITVTLRQAIESFPERIEKDPNLPNLQ